MPFQKEFGRHVPESRPIMSTLNFVGHDPGCVKTHTSEKCGKYNSSTRAGEVHGQHDLTLPMRNLTEIFYARDER
jgi:hypothetical protein